MPRRRQERRGTRGPNAANPARKPSPRCSIACSERIDPPIDPNFNSLLGVDWQDLLRASTLLGHGPRRHALRHYLGHRAKPSRRFRGRKTSLRSQLSARKEMATVHGARRSRSHGPSGPGLGRFPLAGHLGLRPQVPRMALCDQSASLAQRRAEICSFVAASRLIGEVAGTARTASLRRTASGFSASEGVCRPATVRFMGSPRPRSTPLRKLLPSS